MIFQRYSGYVKLVILLRASVHALLNAKRNVLLPHRSHLHAGRTACARQFTIEYIMLSIIFICVVLRYCIKYISVRPSNSGSPSHTVAFDVEQNTLSREVE